MTIREHDAFLSVATQSGKDSQLDEFGFDQEGMIARYQALADELLVQIQKGNL